MEVQDYIQRMGNAYKFILEFLENTNNDEAQSHKIIQLFQDMKIIENKFDLKEIFYIILNMANNHLRTQVFLPKVIHLLNFLKGSIRNHFTNFEIFHIFKSNKRLLLFLLEEKILNFDENIVALMKKDENNLIYFYPEIKNFLSTEKQQKIDKIISSIDSFEEKRRIGENESLICQLIRQDKIIEFISFINMKNYDLNSTINNSIFETNQFLSSRTPCFIEYSAFFGSIQIFKYLIVNKVKLNSDLWQYSMHGQNPEIIHLLEDNRVLPDDDSYKKYFYESIKCHHNDFSSYFQDNYMKNGIGLDKLNLFSYALKYHNYEFFQNTWKNKFVFHDLCQFDYCYLVDLIMKTTKMNIKSKIILKIFIFKK